MKQRLAGWLGGCGLLVCLAVANGEDWPQWRGVNRDGVWRETGLVERFAGPQLPIRWRQPVGSGYSGPTVAAGRVFVTDRLVEPEQVERVHCFDEQTGKPLWKHTYPCVYTISYDAGPRATVTVDGERIYALGAMGHLHCLEAATGKVLWSHDLDREYRITADRRMPIWGIASAPLVYQDLLIVPIGAAGGASVLAFDKQDGRERWRALDDRGQYSAPILVEQAGQPVVVCWTGDAVAGLDPATGKLHWRVPLQPTRMPIGVATPVVQGDRLFMTSFYDGSLMLRLLPDQLAVETIWRRRGESETKTDALHSIISTPVLAGDFVYGVDSYGELRCLNAQNGDRIWEDLSATPKARWSTIHFVENGDRTWMFNERGELIIGKLMPGGFQEISRAALIAPTLAQLRQRNGVCWAHPAFANRAVFARNDQELVCASLAAEP